MAQVSAQDIIARLNAHSEALGDDIIGLVEDINDSITAPVDMSGYVEKSAYDDLKNKYIARFESGDATPPKEEAPKEETKELSYEDILYCSN